METEKVAQPTLLQGARENGPGDAPGALYGKGDALRQVLGRLGSHATSSPSTRHERLNL